MTLVLQRFQPAPRLVLARFGPDQRVRRILRDAFQQGNAPSFTAVIASPLESGISFEHTQSAPSPLWIVNHNLSRFVDVTVTDLAGNEFGADVQRVNQDQVRISLTAPATGRVLIK